MTLKTALIAFTAVAALISAAMIAVPSVEGGAPACLVLGLTRCLSF